MRIFRHYQDLPADARGGAVALGNFDGVHRGHREVLKAARAAARDLGGPWQVMTFEPHPRAFFHPGQPPFRLTPFRIKAREIEALGVDDLFMQHFDADFAALDADAFVEEVLIRGLGVRHVVVGYDYVFGKGRQGTVAFLDDKARAHGFGLTCVPPAGEQSGRVFSSSRVREALEEGDTATAALVLGRPWEIEGRVEAGDARGRAIGFPTANVPLGDYARPRFGVYAVWAGVDAGAGTVWTPGVANVGQRPTFETEEPMLEVHLFDTDRDLYGRHLRVALAGFIRPERRFDGLDALKAQIAEDGARARRILAESDMQPGSRESLEP